MECVVQLVECQIVGLVAMGSNPIALPNASVAQLDRAPRYERGGRGFDPYLKYNKAGWSSGSFLVS